MVFDNAYSSTLRYFKDLAELKHCRKGIYTLQTNNDVIKYIAENKDSIGVIGVNWLIENKKDVAHLSGEVKMMGVKNLKEKKEMTLFINPLRIT